jgi:hypothetical protein
MTTFVRRVSITALLPEDQSRSWLVRRMRNSKPASSKTDGPAPASYEPYRDPERPRSLNGLARQAQQDNAYGMIRWKKQADHYADWGLTFGNPDFVAYAKSYRAGGSVVTADDGLAPALEAAFSAGGVQLVAVPIDYSENIRVLVEELGALNARRSS